MKTQIAPYFLMFMTMLFFVSCQDEATEIINPEEQEVLRANSELVNLMSRVTSQSAPDHLEYINFQYPLTFTKYDVDFQILSFQVIENDNDHQQLLSSLQLDSNVFVGLDYPVTLNISNQPDVVIDSNQTLRDALYMSSQVPFLDIIGDWEVYKNEKQDLFLEGFNPNLQPIYSVQWYDVTSPIANRRKLTFNEDYSFINTYEDVVVGDGVWNELDDGTFSFTFNDSSDNTFSDLTDEYIINFYCDNTMSIKFLIQPPAGNNNFQDTDFYEIEYYRIPETLECSDLIEYQVN